jgi:hypothetical protein
MPPAMKPRSKQETHYVFPNLIIYLIGSAIYTLPPTKFLYLPNQLLKFNLMHPACYDLPPKEIFNFFFFVYIYFLSSV